MRNDLRSSVPCWLATFALAALPACPGRTTSRGASSDAAEPVEAAGIKDSGGNGTMPERAMPSPMKPWDHEVADPSASLVREWEHALAVAEKEGFTPLDDVAKLPDGARVRANSHQWTGRFLSDAASPYRSDVQVRRSVHHARRAAPNDSVDVLRHELSVAIHDTEGRPPTLLEVIVRETVGSLRIDVRRAGLDLMALTETARADAIGWLAERVMRLRGVHLAPEGSEEPHRWTFLHGRLDEGARFSTAPGQSVVSMWSWADRVDGGIERGALFFFAWKKREPTDGTIVILDPRHWFDGKCWEPLRNPPPKGRNP
ncbi:hypothetical protein [Pendulispora albinea]|uniref:Lipoprotein n=1 Tax=Pendulispora albinea TaxID=2741071 RepID=A0ABZ2MA66_9BACT